MVLLDTGTPGTSREIFSEDADELMMMHALFQTTMVVISSFFKEQMTSIFSHCPGYLLDFFKVSVSDI